MSLHDERSFLPYGVRGLSKAWQGPHEHIRDIPATYRSVMVVQTWFGGWRV